MLCTRISYFNKTLDMLEYFPMGRKYKAALYALGVIYHKPTSGPAYIYTCHCVSRRVRIVTCVYTDVSDAVYTCSYIKKSSFSWRKEKKVVEKFLKKSKHFFLWNVWSAGPFDPVDPVVNTNSVCTRLPLAPNGNQSNRFRSRRAVV